MAKTVWSITLVTAAMVALIGGLRAEPWEAHPGLATSGKTWDIQLGKHGESIVRELHQAQGKEYFNLNVGEKGIDGLVRVTKPEGGFEYRIIEVKTRQQGTDFQLGDTKSGKQLSDGWIQDRLTYAAKHHPDSACRKVAQDALAQYLKEPASVPAELHGLGIESDRYVIRRVDPMNVSAQKDIADMRVSSTLDDLSNRAKDDGVRRGAAEHKAKFKQLQTMVKPQIVKGQDFAKQLGQTVGVEEKQMTSALMEASEHVRAPGQSRWVKTGGKAIKFVGNVVGPAGMVIGAVFYVDEAGEIEQRFERGELTRQQADAEQAKLAGTTAGAASGGVAGMVGGAALGTFICPGPGTIIGGIVGGVGGCVGAELMMAATGLTEALGEYLQPGAEAVRNACAYIKGKGIAVTLAARDQVRSWVGAETYDASVAALDSAADWTGNKVVQAARGTKDAAIYVKDQAVAGAKKAKDAAVYVKNRVADGAVAAGETVSDAAGWVWDLIP